MSTDIEPVDDVAGRGLEPVKHLGRVGFPDAVVARAVSLMLEYGSVWQAQRTLRAEMEARGEQAPAYKTVWDWSKANKDVIASIQTDKKRDIVAIYGDASMAFGERMIGAADTLSDSQIAVPAGIVTQRYTELIRPAGGGNQMNVQFNLVTRDTDDG